MTLEEIILQLCCAFINFWSVGNLVWWYLFAFQVAWQLIHCEVSKGAYISNVDITTWNVTLDFSWKKSTHNYCLHLLIIWSNVYWKLMEELLKYWTSVGYVQLIWLVRSVSFRFLNVYTCTVQSKRKTQNLWYHHGQNRQVAVIQCGPWSWTNSIIFITIAESHWTWIRRDVAHSEQLHF